METMRTMMFLSSKLVYKSTQVKNHHVHINIYLTHIVLSTCVAILALLMSPMCRTVPLYTCLHEYV